MTRKITMGQIWDLQTRLGSIPEGDTYKAQYATTLRSFAMTNHLDMGVTRDLASLDIESFRPVLEDE